MVSLTTRLRPGAALKSELTRMEILLPFPSTPPCLLTSTDSRKIQKWKMENEKWKMDEDGNSSPLPIYTPLSAYFYG